MANKGFSIGEAVRFGWRSMRENLLLFIGLIIVSGILNFASQFVSDKFFSGAGWYVKLFLFLLGVAIQYLVALGWVRIALTICDGGKPSFGDLFSGLPFFVNYFLASLLFILILAGGALLLIVPAFIWSVKFSLYGYFIIDKKMGPIEALKASGSTTHGAKWDLVGLGFVSGVIILAGALSLLIGLFAAMPTVTVAYAWAYRKLLSQSQSQSEPLSAASNP